MSGVAAALMFLAYEMDGIRPGCLALAQIDLQSNSLNGVTKKYLRRILIHMIIIHLLCVHYLNDKFVSDFMYKVCILYYLRTCVKNINTVATKSQQ